MKSILIVDTRQTLASEFATSFETIGWYVAVSNNSADAMRRLAGTKDYNVVLFGLQLPESDTVRLVRFARAMEHRSTTAIVVLTRSSQSARQARAAGADEALMESLDLEGIVSAVAKHA